MNIMALMDRMPAFRRHKSPNVAALIGFATGGVGLAIYFKSFIDFLLGIFFATILFGLVATSIEAQAVWFYAGAAWGVYGYLRAVHSNNRLERVPAAA